MALNLFLRFAIHSSPHQRNYSPSLAKLTRFSY
jgi:hypothetical protein